MIIYRDGVKSIGGGVTFMPAVRSSSARARWLLIAADRRGGLGIGGEGEEERDGESVDCE